MHADNKYRRLFSRTVQTMGAVAIGIGFFFSLQKVGAVDGTFTAGSNARPVYQQFSDAFVWAAEQVSPATVLITPGGTTIGSGVIISPEGLLVTNNHVIKNMPVVTVYIAGDRSKPVKGKVLGTHPAADLAVVKLDGNNFPHAKFGNSDLMRPGHFVIAIGAPHGLSQTVTTGILSARRGSGAGQRLQMDAAINPGNSGGPLLNLDGEVIGISNAIRSQGDQGNNGIGFAIPSNLVQTLLPSLIAGANPPTGVPPPPQTYLGVSLEDVDGGKGVRLVAVHENGPAAKAGLKVGDVVTQFNEKPVENLEMLRNLVSANRPGAAVAIQVQRGQEKLNITVQLDERP